MTIYFSSLPFVKKMNLALLSLLVFAPVIGELFLRTCISFDLLDARNPALYADYDEDAYWRLTYNWREKPLRPISTEHERFGWTADESNEKNPLGLWHDSLGLLKPGPRPKVLFYGDSFVRGHSSRELHLPFYLNNNTPDIDVVDLGVAGYGTGQMHLFFKETWRLAGGRPHILIGVMLGDLDRAILSFRELPKPRLTVSEAGGLAPEKTELELVGKNQIREVSAEVPSYLLRFIVRKIRPNETPDDKITRIREIKSLNRAIIRDTKAIADRHQLRLTYVLFYPIWLFEDGGWRECFLKTELDRHGVPYIDTKDALREYLARNQKTRHVFYEETGHHNDLGNRLIGEQIRAFLRLGG